MLVYMFTHVIFSFLSSLTTIYGFCIQDYYTVTGVVSIEYMSVEPIPVLFLTIERCISLKFPARNLRRLQNILFIFGILLMVVLASLGSAFAYFFYLVRQIKTLHIGNNIVMVTLTLEIFLIILPAYSSLLYNLITGKTTASFLAHMSQCFA
uniref:Uncharacterized protein n=1 Tax=Ditylenchus dipsaci TaxID=166011 RepID=A0A915DQU6_9BILA